MVNPINSFATFNDIIPTLVLYSLQISNKSLMTKKTKNSMMDLSGTQYDSVDY